MASYAAQISALQGQINALNTQINRINESCESLQDFKAVVEKSQMDYQSCMHERQKIDAVAGATLLREHQVQHRV